MLIKTNVLLLLPTRVSKRCDSTVAQKFQKFHKILVFECKNEQFPKLLPFFSFVYVLDHFVCAKLSGRNFGRANKLSFRKSARVSKRRNRATVRSRKFFQRLHKILVFERKNAQFIKCLPFFGPFCIFLDVLDHSVCARLLGRDFGTAKKIAFRKSAHNIDKILANTKGPRYV